MACIKYDMMFTRES